MGASTSQRRSAWSRSRLKFRTSPGHSGSHSRGAMLVRGRQHCPLTWRDKRSHGSLELWGLLFFTLHETRRLRTRPASQLCQNVTDVNARSFLGHSKYSCDLAIRHSTRDLTKHRFLARRQSGFRASGRAPERMCRSRSKAGASENSSHQLTLARKKRVSRIVEKKPAQREPFLYCANR